MKLPIIDPLGILKEPLEDALRSMGADVELTDPIRELALGLVAGLQDAGEGEAETERVMTKPPYEPKSAAQFADAVCSTRTGKQKWTTACRDNVVRIVEMWLNNPDSPDENFNDIVPSAATSLPRGIDYASQYRAMSGHTDEREAYLKFGKQVITFDCTRCQAIAEEVAAEYAPDSPKKQLECIYYIKMFDENEIGTDGYDTAKGWLEAHDLKDKLYAAYLSELGVES